MGITKYALVLFQWWITELLKALGVFVAALVLLLLSALDFAHSTNLGGEPPRVLFSLEEEAYRE